MRLQTKLLIVPVAVAVMAIASTSGLAQNVNQNGQSTQPMRRTIIQHRTTITTRTVPRPVQNTRLQQARALHARAVQLAHRATLLARNGHPRQSAAVAAQAQSLFHQSFRMSHPQFFAHQTGR